MTQQKQSGNAMLYVLIGIVLFAALSYAFTRSSRSISTLSAEDARFSAQEIISYAEKINNAVQAVMLQNGCLRSQINFANPTVTGYTNASAPANNRCDIFNTAGGGMTYEAPPVNAIDTAAAAATSFATVGALAGQYFFAGNVCVHNAGSGPFATCASDGSALNEDLVLFVPFIRQEVCTAVNQVLGNTAAMITDTDGSFNATKFTGTYVDGFAIGAAGTVYQLGCYQTTAGSTPGAGYHFYLTLIAN